MYNISANTIFTGKSLVYLPTCHSTNDYANMLISEGNPMEGTLIITPIQTAGKGQRGNSWEAEPGKNLTFSLILRPSFLTVAQQYYLNIISSLAVRETTELFLKTSIKVKWPNDIYLNDKKIAGILIQNSIQKTNLTTSIVGIGLNVNQEHFTDKKAISMNIFSQHEFSTNEVLNSLLENLEKYYLLLRNNQFETLKKQYTHHLYRFGEEHLFISQGESFKGTIIGFEENGKLLIQLEHEIKGFYFKEVEFTFDS